MRRLWWKFSLGLTLTLGVSAQADELQWRSAGNMAPVSPPKVILEAPRVLLGDPVPAETKTVQTPTWVPHGTHRVVRAQGGEIPNPLPKTEAALPTPRPLNPPQISEGGNNLAQQIPHIPHGIAGHQGQPLPLHGTPIAPLPGVVQGPIVSTAPPGCNLPGMEAPLYSNGQMIDGGSGYLPGWETVGGMFTSNRFYADADYLLWWTKGSTAPVLLTTGSALSPTGGNLGDPTTQVLVSGDDTLGGQRSGGRFRMGWWCDDCHDLGIEAGGFFLGEAVERQQFSSNAMGMPLLARPFFSVNPAPGFPFGQESSELVALPGQFSGSTSFEAKSNFWGADINLRKRLAGNCGYRMDGLVGFRFLSLSDSLTATENIQGLIPGTFAFGTNVMVTDQFKTSNQFYGGQFGLDTRWTMGRWSMDLLTKIGIGSTSSTVEINGSQTVFSGGTTSIRPGNFAGGLLALPGNIGRYHQETFSVVPEVGLNLGYQLTDHIRLVGGYNFLYWSSVMRAGEQIDRSIDESRVPNLGLGLQMPQPALLNRPIPLMRSTDYWAHGLNLGVHVTW